MELITKRESPASGSKAFYVDRVTQSQWAGAAVLLGVLIAIYLPTLIWMLHRWMAAESYYSHGFLVPVVSLWLLWLKRGEIYDHISSKGRSAPGHRLGMVLIVAAVVLHLLSGYFRVYFTSGFSMVILLSGIVVYLFGKGILRSTWFALVFFLFMVPLPLLVVSGLNLKLKLLATSAALQLLDLTGVLAVQDGSTIILTDDTLTVGNVCSGLRSIISLLALGALYAWLFRGTVRGEHRAGVRIKQVMLFVLSIPVAMAANILRIYFLGLVAESYGSAVATGLVHDISGYLLFAVAFGLLYLCGRILDAVVRT